MRAQGAQAASSPCAASTRAAISFLSFVPMGINPESLPKTQEDLAQKDGKVQRAIEEVNLSLSLRLFFTPNSVRRERNPPASWRYLLRAMMRAPWRSSIKSPGYMCAADDAGTGLGTLADVLSSSATTI
jgi:hypothetical protein